MAKRKPKKKPATTPLNRAAKAFGRELGKLLATTSAAAIADFDVALTTAENHVQYADVMTDEQRDHALAGVAAMRGALEVLLLAPADRLQRTIAMDIVEAKFRKLHPLAGPLKGIERLADYITAHTATADEIAQVIRMVDEMRNGELIAALATLDPEAHAASIKRLDAARNAAIAKEGN